ncbi:MAG: hypothetical protein US45_C0012G0004 [Candidatus Nomurabacteria bacterium GW2011_GWA1_37_20]|uniref:Uncharacterized protein n=1 Tax=Candidatus Nomurabacteria bacterium GW2011_GWA1_37_20 TaxID=1618729 RepID=A0A0G0H436_9BACT|nr:MAG: hypothetical protein US45_C0012G0004 [Candidatus Nomurabacteria bacterium GW2011_GWA1_37_20]KKQ38129.1 MAG: hypothetical protein US55_C0014G0008 [Candidatus Levybacteria bacterium GW2011_GWC2_37_7]KKQ41048.1 MAG: hypothetical protein US59_C0040G0004 [Candidatus Levybacteria bacterium GW2011_GWB1_37_8]
MKSTKHKDTKEQYEKIVKLVEKAEKAAEKFVQKSMSISPQPQIKYF